MKRHFIKTFLPIGYFLVLSGYWFFDGLIGANSINYIALISTVFLLVLMILRNKIMGAIFGVIACIISFWMFLAVLAEFKEFKIISQDAIELIIAGSILSVLTFVMALKLSINNISTLKHRTIS